MNRRYLQHELCGELDAVGNLEYMSGVTHLRPKMFRIMSAIRKMPDASIGYAVIVEQEKDYFISLGLADKQVVFDMPSEIK